MDFPFWFAGVDEVDVRKAAGQATTLGGGALGVQQDAPCWQGGGCTAGGHP